MAQPGPAERDMWDLAIYVCDFDKGFGTLSFDLLPAARAIPPLMSSPVEGGSNMFGDRGGGNVAGSHTLPQANCHIGTLHLRIAWPARKGEQLILQIHYQ